MRYTKENMRIAYFIGTLKKADGVGLVLLDLVRHAKMNGHECIIVTGWVEEPERFPVTVIEVPAVVFPLYREYQLPLPGIHGFAAKLDEWKPDIIHVHSPETLARAAAKYARQRRIPIIATHHTDFARYLTYYHIEFLTPFVWYLLRSIYNRMLLTTTPSPVTAADLEAHGVKNVHVLPWGIDFARFDTSFRSDAWRTDVLKPGTNTVVLCVCRLTWEKDLRTLAEAYHILMGRRNDLTMVVAGDGPARAELETLMPGARFFGRLDSHALSTTYASSDIFLFPSSTETFGSVTIEAMASGAVPVVADAVGSKSLVENGVTGFRVAPKDAVAFAARVEELIENHPLRTRMQRDGLSFVKRFKWETVFETLMKLYTDTIDSYRRS
jgi:glycosyltransferase involved in cell wall biosynthesis